MSNSAIHPTGVEVYFDPDEIIVSKTDPKGRLTYANDVFLRIAGYTEAETLGQPHSFIRHPGMPRCVFQLLWDTIQNGQEIFAYVINITKSGDHYWVLAHVTPTFDDSGAVAGYHSSRRVPERSSVGDIIPLYLELCEIEAQHSDRQQGTRESTEALLAKLEALNLTYSEFVFALAG